VVGRAHVGAGLSALHILIDAVRLAMSESKKVHGLDGTWVEPDWLPPTLPELRALLATYPELGEPIEISFTSPRPLSAAAVVKTSRGRLFVKRQARAVRDREGLLEEHRFIAHLIAHGACVPRVLVNANGDSAVEIGESTYEVHGIGSGVDLYADAISWTPFFCVAHAREAGKALAKLHLSAKSFDAPRRKPQPLVASFTIFAEQDADFEMNRYLSSRHALAQHPQVRRCANEALEALKPYHSELRPLLPYLKPAWTHNDLHASNLLWSGSGENAQATAVIDFSLADRTNVVHDLANIIERNIVGWLELARHPKQHDEVPVHFDHLDALLAGYDSVRPLSPEEAFALAPMTALCHAEFALSEADYFLSVLHSESRARMAYESYFLGHARWFASRRGSMLLDALRHWADARTRSVQGTGHL
jgi:Ser/Thr protein kinase RdoA (MazF antagonist)